MKLEKHQRVISDDVWTTPVRGRRGPKPRHSRQQVLRAAMAIADADGLTGLSMETLARKLRMTPMALYRYVPGKAELIAIMVDEGLGPPPQLRGRWRARLTTWARAMERVLVAHPWSIEATARLRAMGPNELAWLEAGMASLAQTPLSIAERHEACLAIISIVRTRAQFAAVAGLSGSEWADAARKVIADRADGYPELDALLRTARRPGRLEQSVAWVLDGIAARASSLLARPVAQRLGRR